MQHLSTAFLILALVIVVNQDGATAEFFNYDKSDQVAEEAKNRAVTIIDGPKYVAPPALQTIPPTASNYTNKPEQRPPSKPPINHNPDKQGKPKLAEVPRVYIGQIQNLPPLRSPYPKPLKLQQPPNSVYKYHKVVPLQPSKSHGIYQKQQSLVFAASTSKPAYIPKSPKFSLPVETINGIRTDFVRPPHFANSTTSTTTTTVATTTAARHLRTKRIWPKHILEKKNATKNASSNDTSTSNKNSTSAELQSSSSNQKFIYLRKVESTSTVQPSTTRKYQRVTRVPKRKPSTPAPSNFSTFAPNDWVPIIPSHYTVKKVRKPRQIPINRRSDTLQRRSDFLYYDNDSSAPRKRMYYMQSFGLVPVSNSQSPEPSPSASQRNKIIFVGKTKHLKPHVYSGSRGKPVLHTSRLIAEYQSDGSHPPKIVTRIKHHHHHHHHKYVKTVQKPVRVEVPKPVPVPVPVPMPVKVEHRVPYPVQVKVPHPFPVKVVEKEYVPKPYPVYHQVPVLKQVPVPVEKRVPYPVRVEVPVPKPYPVTVEKKVPYPVPVKVLVPQPYNVETRVPYPVQVPVKEPVEVIKHVEVKVPVPQPYPVPVEKRVPYPVEVEKKVPVPFKVLVPQKVEVEKRVPVYIPRPYPVEKKVPVRVPYPVKVPVGIPIFLHPGPSDIEHVVTGQVSVEDEGVTNSPQHFSHYSYSVNGNTVSSSPANTIPFGNSGTELPHETVTYHGNTISSTPHESVTVHGNTRGNSRFTGFQSRSDVVEETTMPYTTNTAPSTGEATNTQQVSINTEYSTTVAIASTEISKDSSTATSTVDPR